MLKLRVLEFDFNKTGRKMYEVLYDIALSHTKLEVFNPDAFKKEMEEAIRKHLK